MEAAAQDPPPYGDTVTGATYWDVRYAAAGDDSFDWYMDYAKLREILNLRLPGHLMEPEILDVGCGTSELAACLWKDMPPRWGVFFCRVRGSAK